MKHSLSTKTHTILSVLISGFFLLCDIALKHFAYTHQTFTAYLVKPWFGWEYFGNGGVAFSIPLPGSLILALTPIVVTGILVMYYKKQRKSFLFSLGTFLLVFGAVSNFIDRLSLGVTIDYIRVVTSVINVADIMIVAGALLLLTSTKSTPSSSTVDPTTKE